MAFMSEGNTAIVDCQLMHITEEYTQSQILAEFASKETGTQGNLKSENEHARIAEIGILGGARTTRHAVDAGNAGRKSVRRLWCHAEDAASILLGAHKKEAGTSSTFARLVVTKNERPRKRLGCQLLLCINAIAAVQ